jgi:hypothetical protein
LWSFDPIEIILRVQWSQHMILTRKPLDWQQLRGRTFQTITGTRFTVVRVTSKNVTIRPERGTRNYAISIQDELERVLDGYAVGGFFPSPTELLRSGVRAVPSSYAWGILHTMLNEGPEAKSITARAEDFAGRWRLTELSELDEDYFAESDEPPFIQIRAPKQGRIYGQYHFGLSNGNLDGEVREFGGEPLLLFSFEGSDEMDQVNGAGWAQLEDREHLIGELLGEYGRFTAERERVRQRPSSSRLKKIIG